ncbi:MAG: cardiolipin synthase [Paracoccus sp. (in: a-proteobacteria)]|nr:cardiolipin synthase [Paracoccus sp. (in: a-proteobacteria)]
MWASLLFVLHFTVALGIVLRVLTRPRLEPSTRLAWVMVVEALPLIGIAAYILFGEIRISRAERQKRADVRARIIESWRPSPAVVDTPPGFARTVVEAGRGVGGLAAVGGNDITLLAEDDSAIDAVADAIDAARENVHLLFYIWLDDVSGRKVASAVARASLRGVSCRVVVDALGSRAFMRSDAWREMEAAGAELVSAFPLRRPLILQALWRRLDLRNHRKIAIIDGKIGFTGSRNCADMSFSAKPRYAPWVDVLFAIRGPALRQMQSVFMADWMSYTGENLMDLLDWVPPAPDGRDLAQVIATGPDRRGGSIAETLVAMLYSAREKVLISTPYYVPDQSLDAALAACARRGVSVTMILPERNDSLIVGATSEGFYHGLLAAGVRIFLFRPGLLHAKLLSVDGRMVMMGSANLDRRSFELNYEMNMLLIGEDITGAIDARQQSYIERARELPLSEVTGWPLWRRLRNNLLALASPLL